MEWSRIKVKEKGRIPKSITIQDKSFSFVYLISLEERPSWGMQGKLGRKEKDNKRGLGRLSTRKQRSSHDASIQNRRDLPCSNFEIQITSQGSGGDWGGQGGEVRKKERMKTLWLWGG